MIHVNGWCFRGIYKGGLWEEDLHVSAQKESADKNPYRHDGCAYSLTVGTQKFDFIAFHFLKAHPSALKISP